MRDLSRMKMKKNFVSVFVVVESDFGDAVCTRVGSRCTLHHEIDTDPLRKQVQA